MPTAVESMDNHNLQAEKQADQAQQPEQTREQLYARDGTEEHEPTLFHDQETQHVIKPETVLLKDGRTYATLHPFYDAEQVPEGLLKFLNEEFNHEIIRGDTYPFVDPMDIDTFKHHWFGSFGAVLIIGSEHDISLDTKWEEKVLGTFYIKPNYPGRCAHVCNAGFVVNEYIRGKGIGSTMAELYLKWAPKLGYAYSVFNLVFETNIASIKIWDRLGFEKIGYIKGAGRLRGHRRPVGAFIYGRELDPVL